MLVLSFPVAMQAQHAVLAGELIVEPPTLICLGFEWKITGDDNRNAAAEVGFRRVGEQNWRPALPLLRIGGERTYDEAVNLDYTSPHMFAGSDMDLEPGTEY